MEALDHARKADKRSNAQSVGVGTHSTAYALRAVSAQDEARILALPAFAQFRKQLQNSAGKVYFMPGIHTPGDVNHPVR